ncbi:MAG: hypothetical protein RL660_191 [Bacteroidota bacterium]|jgi:hypothetical protein
MYGRSILSLVKASDLLVLKAVALFLCANLLQAYFTPLCNNEALYVLYSKHLQWCYIDHPPVVAWLIHFVGDTQSTLLVRLPFIFCNAICYLLLWALVRHKVEPVYFLMSCACFVLMSFFGFMATPDNALLLAIALYLFVLQKFLKQSTISSALLLGFCAALAIYCKYHAILIVCSTLLVQWRRFNNAHTYFALLACCICLTPLVWWQYQNGFPSLQLHLVQRNSGFKLENVVSFILTIALLYMPVCLVVRSYFRQWFLLDEFQKCLVASIILVLGVFAIKSFSLNIFAHWLLCIVPAAILLFAGFLQESLVAFTLFRFIKFQRLSFALITIVAVGRIFIAIPQSGIRHDFSSQHAQVAWINEQAQDKQILVVNDPHTAVQFAWFNKQRQFGFVRRFWSLPTHLEQWHKPITSNNLTKTFIVSTSTHFPNCDSCTIDGTKFYYGAVEAEALATIY